jgi:hypothetical protein
MEFCKFAFRVDLLVTLPLGSGLDNYIYARQILFGILILVELYKIDIILAKTLGKGP